MKKLILVLLYMCLPVANTFAEGIDEYTVLILHCNGEDGSTVLVDSSYHNHIVTATGNSQIDTAQSKFGGASCLFDGSGDYLILPDSEDWNFGGGDFTIDFWIYFDTTGHQWDSEADLVSQHKDVNNYWKVAYHSGALWFFASVNGGIQQIGISGGIQALPLRWYHIAVIRNGNSWNLYIDGTLIASANSSVIMPDFNVPLFIGGNNVFINQDLKGWMDEIRISKGIARWTSNFTPPTYEYGAFPNISPIANAGIDVVANVGEEVILDGKNSYDPDGEIISWIWKSLSDPQWPVVAEGEIATMKAHGYAEELIELTVTDNRGASSTDTVMIINPGIEGPPGPQGPQGEQGLQGPSGITPEEIAVMQNQIDTLREQNVQQQTLIDQNRYLLEQLPQLRKKIEELETQVP